jgi:hypothetical protein
VQIKTSFTRYCPTFLDEDRLSINPNLAFKGLRIYDSTTGALHCLRPEGVVFMSQLAAKTTFSQLKQSATEAGIRPPQLADLLGFLNLIGGLSHYRPVFLRPKGLVYRLLIWRAHTPFYKRKHASLSSLAAQILIVCLPITVSSAILGTLLTLAGVLSLRSVVEIVLTWNAILVTSIYLHEAAHLAILLYEAVPADIMRHGLRVGLLHRSLDPTSEIRLASAGPISGLVSCALAFSACKALGLPTNLVMIVLVGLIHLGSFLPWYGDGASLRLALHNRSAP